MEIMLGPIIALGIFLVAAGVASIKTQATKLYLVRVWIKILIEIGFSSGN